MTDFLAGAATALLVLAVLNRRTVWEYINEECRYRRGSIHVWWMLRKELTAKGRDQ